MLLDRKAAISSSSEGGVVLVSAGGDLLLSPLLLLLLSLLLLVSGGLEASTTALASEESDLEHLNPGSPRIGLREHTFGSARVRTLVGVLLLHALDATECTGALMLRGNMANSALGGGQGALGTSSCGMQKAVTVRSSGLVERHL